MLLTTTLLSALLSTTTARALPGLSPLHPRATNNGSFTLLATNSNSTAVSNQPIHAHSHGLFINATTSSHCPSNLGASCPTPGNITALTASGTGDLFMDVAVPGGQALYVTKDGTIKYTRAHHGEVPEGAMTDLFVYRSDYGEDTFGSLTTKGDATGFVACPRPDGSWRVKVALTGHKHSGECVGMTIATYVFDGVAAYEYK